MTTSAALLALIVSLFAQPLLATTVRDSLMDSGERLLEDPSGTKDFVAKVERLEAESPLSRDERAYLQDLADKLPERLRREICPQGDELVCGPELPPRAENPLFAGSLDQGPPPTPPVGPPSSAWSKSWIVAAVAGGLLLSYGFRGKEIQISAP